MIKSAPWILAVLSLLIAIYLFILLLNAGKALDNSRTEVMRLSERSDLALSIIRKEWIGRGVPEVSKLQNEAENKGITTGVEKNTFELGDVIFETESGSVTEVRYID